MWEMYVRETVHESWEIKRDMRDRSTETQERDVINNIWYQLLRQVNILFNLMITINYMVLHLLIPLYFSDTLPVQTLMVSYL